MHHHCTAVQSPVISCPGCFRSLITETVAASSLAVASAHSQHSSQIIFASATGTSVALQGSPNKSPRPLGTLTRSLCILLTPHPTAVSQACPRSDRPHFCLRAFALADPPPGTVLPKISTWLFSGLPSGLCSYVSFSVRLSLSTLFTI